MSTTTFSGPVKAGGISTSTGNILGENVVRVILLVTHIETPLR